MTNITEGNIIKMKTALCSPVSYKLKVGDEFINMNDLIGKEIELEFLGRINCIKCGKKTKTSFAQGFCYTCFISAPETEECGLRPELCKAQDGIARDMEWAENNCLIDHFVYLSITSGLKVGVTRNTQIPTRWIDQGAVKAIRLAKTPNRYLAGIIETNLMKHVADKTNWRNMLKNIYDESIDLVSSKEKIGALLSDNLQQYIIEDNEITEINYPVIEYPEKVTSINLEKEPKNIRTLLGIKGQYLIFNEGKVINIRKYNGYYIKFKY